ncbi:MAG: methyltransferase family protein [Nitrospiria bacterium]
MDSVRYYLAIVVLVTFPAALPFWLLVHPFIKFWRQIGLLRTYTIHLSLFFLIAGGLFLLRGPLLMIDFGTSPTLTVLAVPIFVLACFVDLRRRRYLTEGVRFGLPELAPERFPPRLLKEGIYARIRHPTYVAILLGLFAFALFTNYLAVYLLFIPVVVAGYFIVRFEEKELKNRFGDQYTQYCEAVPRFIPVKIGRRKDDNDNF